MGEKLGATVELDKVPLKYAGLRYDEIWISEAQERMVLSVPQDKLDELLELARERGRRGDRHRHVRHGRTQELVLNYRGTEVGRLSMDFLHDGIPMPTREGGGRRAWHGRLGPCVSSRKRMGETPMPRERAAPRSCSPIPTSPPSTGSSASTTTRCRAAR